MPDLVDRLSDNDDAEQHRKHNVASKNEVIFNALTQTVGERISRYNARHPVDRWVPNELQSNRTYDESGVWSLEIKKTKKPISSLNVKFPINDGALQFYGPGGTRETIILDIKKEVAIYYVSGKAHSVDEIADFFLSQLFHDVPAASKKQIGFHPV